MQPAALAGLFFPARERHGRTADLAAPRGADRLPRESDESVLL
ncbi:hypothetical protein L665_01599 [Ralstonia solanacearum SD54]|nr:hypothetical protein L665_01599 [Ralstonia solanacearum SD54]